MPPSQSNDGTPQFSQLWPTQFMSLRLPGNETANPVLADFVLAQNIQNDDMTVDYTADNIFVTDHPALIWLRQCCDRAVLDYAREAGISYELEWVLQGWANVNMKGDYHNLHNHPHSWLSGTYYISVPDQSGADLFRSDLNPASISFFDPRPQANMNAIRNDGQVDPEHRLCQAPAIYFYGQPFYIILCIPTWLSRPVFRFHSMSF